MWKSLSVVFFFYTFRVFIEKSMEVKTLRESSSNNQECFVLVNEILYFLSTVKLCPYGTKHEAILGLDEFYFNISNLLHSVHVNESEMRRYSCSLTVGYFSCSFCVANFVFFLFYNTFVSLHLILVTADGLSASFVCSSLSYLNLATSNETNNPNTRPAHKMITAFWCG